MIPLPDFPHLHNLKREYEFYRARNSPNFRPLQNPELNLLLLQNQSTG